VKKKKGEGTCRRRIESKVERGSQGEEGGHRERRRGGVLKNS